MDKGKPTSGFAQRKLAEEKRDLKKQKRAMKQELFAELAVMRNKVQGGDGEGPDVQGRDAEGAGLMQDEAFALVEQIVTCGLTYRANSLQWASKVLGVPVTTDATGFKKAFRLRLLKVHPDQNSHPQAREALEALQRSFEFVSRQLFGAKN